MKRLICALTAHDWFALAYPPARRWECLRCGEITEDVSTVDLLLQGGNK